MIFGKDFYVLLCLIVEIILFIIFLKHFQKVFDECYREKVDSGMAFFFFRCCHGGHKGGNKMIIREDFDTKLRKALAIHYGLDKVFVEKIHPTGFDAYRIEI